MGTRKLLILGISGWSLCEVVVGPRAARGKPLAWGRLGAEA
jgi:hypothetical protein